MASLAVTFGAARPRERTLRDYGYEGRRVLWFESRQAHSQGSGGIRRPFCPLYFGDLREVELPDPLAAQVF